MLFGKKMINSGKKFIISLILFLSPFLFAQEEQEKIVFGLTGTVYKGDLKTFDEWKNYLEKKLNKEVEIKFSRTYAEMRTMLELGSVDIAYVCNSTYVKLREQNSVNLLNTPVSNGKEVYYSYIIAKKKSQYSSIKDFKNKLFAFTDPNSTSGAIALSFYLLKDGYQPKKYFKELIYTYEHGESIKAVLEDFVDGASIDSLVYEQFIKRFPDDAKELAIVHKLGPFSMSPLVAKSSLNKKTFDSIQNIFLNMHKSEKGKEILNDLSLDKLNPPNPAFKEVKAMMEFIEKSQE